MAASENAALPGGKVGGVGDVVRDLPRALAREGWRSKVLTPEYGLFAGLPGARQTGQLDVEFGGRRLAVADLEGPLRSFCSARLVGSACT